MFNDMKKKIFLQTIGVKVKLVILYKGGIEFQF